MEEQNTIQAKIAQTLRDIGRPSCLEKAAELESENHLSRSLHLRRLELQDSDAIEIAKIFNAHDDEELAELHSFSLSYNDALSDKGLITLIDALPYSLREIGLVHCGMGDEAGRHVLLWIKKTTSLRMICAEQNSFSAALKNDFSSFSTEHPKVMVIV